MIGRNVWWRAGFREDKKAEIHSGTLIWFVAVPRAPQPTESDEPTHVVVGIVHRNGTFEEVRAIDLHTEPRMIDGEDNVHARHN